MVASNFNLADCFLWITGKKSFAFINKWYERQERLDQLEYALDQCVRLRYLGESAENSAS